MVLLLIGVLSGLYYISPCISLWCISTVGFCIYYYFNNNKNKNEQLVLAGVYRQGSGFKYWAKVVFFYCLMKFRKWKDHRDQEKSKDRDHTKTETYNSGYGTRSKVDPKEMDKLQPLSSHFQGIDAIYFNGAELKENGFYIVTGTARRPQGVVNGFLIFRIPNFGILVSKKFPDSLLFGAQKENEKYFGAEGFQYKPIEAMKHWELSFDGEMKEYDELTKTTKDKIYKVNLKANWKSNLAFFDYDVMIPPWTMARGVAKESWSREYFNALKEAHQTHYEQHGDLEGVIKVDGQNYSFKMPSMRDHSYGVKRDWKLLHRYMFHMFCTADGYRFDVGIVSQPVTCSFLELGYMYDKDGTLLALESVDMPLHFLGENGVPPTDYAFTVKTTDKKIFYIQVQVLETQQFYIGWEWEAKIWERRCKFIVNGRDEGFGVSECHYRNTTVPRSIEAKNEDPEWVKKYDNSNGKLY